MSEAGNVVGLTPGATPRRRGKTVDITQAPRLVAHLYADPLSAVFCHDIEDTWLTVGRRGTTDRFWRYDMTEAGYQELVQEVAAGRMTTSQQRNQRTADMHLKARRVK